MLFKSPKGLRRVLATFKWCGCLTALAFAMVGLIFELVPLGDAFQILSQGIWVVVGIAMAFGSMGAVLDPPIRGFRAKPQFFCSRRCI